VADHRQPKSPWIFHESRGLSWLRWTKQKAVRLGKVCKKKEASTNQSWQKGRNKNGVFDYKHHNLHSSIRALVTNSFFTSPRTQRKPAHIPHITFWKGKAQIARWHLLAWNRSMASEVQESAWLSASKIISVHPQKCQCRKMETAGGTLSIADILLLVCSWLNN